MSRETEIGTQKLESSSETIELRFGQEPEIDTSVTELSDDELTLKSVDERIILGEDPILRRVEAL